MGSPRHVGMEWFVVRDVDDHYTPTDKPVLRVALIGSDLLSLQICHQTEGSKEFKLTQLAQIVVDAEPFVHGLNAAMRSVRVKHDGTNPAGEEQGPC